MKRCLISILLTTAFLDPSPGVAAIVNYQGFLEDGFFPGDDFVIAGTFLPGFNPFSYPYVYGDAFGNLTDPHHYNHAVADGNFRPIGTGTLADVGGFFSGSGTAAGIDNLPIYLFLFDHANPDGLSNLALVSSSNPSWRVQNDGIANLNGGTANVVVMGTGVIGGRISLGIPPVPEPASAAFLLLGAACCLRRRGRHGSLAIREEPQQ
jgi:hypothetical protein